jgi:hypothetical protein
MSLLVSEKHLFRKNFIYREKISRSSTTKVFLDWVCQNEVRLKNGYIIKGESVTRIGRKITEIQVSYDPIVVAEVGVRLHSVR